ncbi:hypothetical protein FM102_05415 [Corynebacterium glutamicum]|nr:hypothetical protein FM102_05415 [Corynebacterium glutamicum]
MPDMANPSGGWPFFAFRRKPTAAGKNFSSKSAVFLAIGSNYRI